MSYKIYTVAERSELEQQIGQIHNAVWPPFMKHSTVINLLLTHLYSDWPQFQLALCDDSDTVVAAAESVPLRWDGTVQDLPEGWDGAGLRAIEGLRNGVEPNALSACAIVVAPEHQRGGHSTTMLTAMRSAGEAAGLHALIACVRPTFKSRYPLTPFNRYVAWKRPDETAFDPWMRVHLRAGAEQSTPAHRSMEITGSVEEWQEWTGLTFPDSGPYVVDGALQPVQINLEENKGIYHDPNIWMIHKLNPGTREP